jgi:hypothetical protein
VSSGLHVINKASFQLVTAVAYHATPLAARKTGSSALEPKYRPPSTKQKKRHARRLKREAVKYDHEKETVNKQKRKHVVEQFKTEDMKAFIDDLRER